jgi:hypothetical protein
MVRPVSGVFVFFISHLYLSSYLLRRALKKQKIRAKKASTPGGGMRVYCLHVLPENDSHLLGRQI